MAIMAYSDMVIISGWGKISEDVEKYHEGLYTGLIKNKIVPTFIGNRGLLESYLSKWERDPDRDNVLFVLGEGVVGKEPETEIRQKLSEHGVNIDSVHLLGELIARGDEGYTEVVEGWNKLKRRGNSKEARR